MCKSAPHTHTLSQKRDTPTPPHRRGAHPHPLTEEGHTHTPSQKRGTLTPSHRRGAHSHPLTAEGHTHTPSQKRGTLTPSHRRGAHSHPLTEEGHTHTLSQKKSTVTQCPQCRGRGPECAANQISQFLLCVSFFSMCIYHIKYMLALCIATHNQGLPPFQSISQLPADPRVTRT